MVYTFVVAAGLLTERILPERAWLLMALPCVAPMLWCASGFFTGRGNTGDAGEQDAGLALSAVGWLLLIIGLAFKHFAIVAAQPDAFAAQASSPVTPLCIGLGVLFLLIGAALSWFAWAGENN